MKTELLELKIINGVLSSDEGPIDAKLVDTPRLLTTTSNRVSECIQNSCPGDADAYLAGQVLTRLSSPPAHIQLYPNVIFAVQYYKRA